jgi:hypothetical protein
MNSELNEATLCSCMGPVGADPYCPCEMRRQGLTPTEIWTPEKVAELKEVMQRVFVTKPGKTNPD